MGLSGVSILPFIIVRCPWGPQLQGGEEAISSFMQLLLYRFLYPPEGVGEAAMSELLSEKHTIHPMARIWSNWIWHDYILKCILYLEVLFIWYINLWVILCFFVWGYNLWSLLWLRWHLTFFILEMIINVFMFYFKKLY